MFIDEAGRVEANGGHRPRIMLSGCPMSGGNTKVPDIIEARGGVIVAEESCTGTRSFGNLVDEDKDPMMALAERYIKIPCSCMTPNDRRIDKILELAKEFKVDGVVYYTLQSCHGYNIERYKVQQALRKAGIPMLAIETDYSDSDVEQIGIRVDAFMEMLHDHRRYRRGLGHYKGRTGKDGIIGYVIRPTGFDFLSAAENAYKDVIAAMVEKRRKGYSRPAMAETASSSPKSISEITAHARGVYTCTRTQGIIDIGGQDSKVIVVESGRVTEFLMNDKCAAGTGKFLEYTAKALEVSIDELGRLALLDCACQHYQYVYGVRRVRGDLAPGEQGLLRRISPPDWSRASPKG